MKKFSIAQLHKKKKNFNWYGVCKENGKYISRTSLGSLTKKEAELWKRSQEFQYFNPTSHKIVETKLLKLAVREHMKHLESVYNVPNTLVKYLNYLEKFYRWGKLPLELDNFDLFLAQSYVDYLSNHLAPKTVSENFKVIRAFFKRCVSYKWILENPFDNKLIKLPKIIKKEKPFWTDAQIETILRLVDEPTYPFWLTLCKTGLRHAEAKNLTFENVSFKDREIRVIGKGSKFRKIPLCNTLYDVLVDLKKQFGTGLCFPNLPITGCGCRRMLKRFLRGSEIEAKGEVNIHRFRHSFASNLIRKAYPIIKVSKLLGHATVDETIKTYLHLLPTDCDDVVKYLDSNAPNFIPFKQAG